MIEINIANLSKPPLLTEEMLVSSKKALMKDIQGFTRTTFQELFKKLDYSREHGSPCKEGMILFQIGDLLEKEGHLTEALGYFQLSFKIAEKFQDYDEQGTVLLRVGSVLFKLGEHEAALESVQRAHQLYEKFTRQTIPKNGNGVLKSENVNVMLSICCTCGRKLRIPLKNSSHEQRIIACCDQEFVFNHRSSDSLHNINLSYQSSQDTTEVEEDS
ncbi:MAG: tetratricopeptide repeat protein [Promethearchaeota archaeon]